MGEAMIRKRCIELTAGWLLDQGLVGLVHSVYRAACADGLEKAAKIAEANYKRLHPEHSQDYYSGYSGAGYDITKDIRQHVKEMGHER